MITYRSRLTANVGEKILSVAGTTIIGAIIGGGGADIATHNNQVPAQDMNIARAAVTDFTSLTTGLRTIDAVAAYKGTNPVVRLAVADCYRPPNLEDNANLRDCLSSKAQTFNTLVYKPMQARNSEAKQTMFKATGLGSLAGFALPVAAFALLALRRPSLPTIRKSLLQPERR